MAVTLLFTAVRLSDDFLRLTRIPAGFDTGLVWSGSVDVASGHFEPLLDSISSIPGVGSVSGCNALPFNPSGVWIERLNLPGRVEQRPPAEAQVGLVFPADFQTMRIPILRGRTFAKADQHAAVIDAELARRYFPNEDPIGNGETIIGVVGSVHNSDLGGPRDPEVYYSEFQQRAEAMYLTLRMKSDVDPTAAVRKGIARLDPGAALWDVQWMQERLDASLELRKFVAFLLDGLALIGLLLAVIGLYGSLAQLVELRRREIGIRMAMGAGKPQIVRLISTRGAAVVGLGLLVGGFGAAFAAEQDAGSWIAVVLAIGTAGGIAIYLPARRASQTDPATALRHN